MTPNGKARFGDAFPDLSFLSDEPGEFDSPDRQADSSLLEPQETSQRNITDWTYRGRFMTGKEKEYEATHEAYMEMYGSPSNSHLMGIRECRKFASFAREKITGEVKVMASACRDRWCPMCSGQKSKYAKEQCELYIKSLKVPRFLTLTLRNDGAELQHQLEFLSKCFVTLRNRAYWKRNVTGGVWFLQVKRGKNSGCWHPHLHILLDGDYMEQGRLSALWEQVTYGSPVIDIRRINNVEEAASYVARYSARPAILADQPLEDRITIIKALFGKRLAGTFGTGKTVTLTPPKIKDDSEWSTIGFYDVVVGKAESDPAAKAVLIAYNAEIPLTESEYLAYTGTPVYIEVPDYVTKKPKQFLLDFYNS